MVAAEWSSVLLKDVERALSKIPGKNRVNLDKHVGVHLAIFVEPYLSLVLDGKKTIESRFGTHRCAPHGRVAPRDILLLKKAGGPVVGICRVTETWSFDLRKTAIDALRDQFATALCAEDPVFWAQRAHATLATLMRIEGVTLIDPISVAKRDRRGWVTLRDSASLFAWSEI